MNFRITFTFLFVAFLALGMSAQVIWGGPGDPNGEFDGGLNDWTTTGLSSHVPDSSANAVWAWTPDGLSLGSLFGTRGAIESESASNGAAIFDSDFLDNAGNIQYDADGNVDPGSVGMGSAPSFEPGGFSGAGHSGVLTSPVIDCSEESAVVLRFYSYFRSFTGLMFVDVSNDNGATYTAFPVNTNDDLDDTPDNIVTLNISEVAGNADSVRIQFRWEGSYYYWMIDDVALLSLPGNDLTMVNSPTSPFYTPHSAVQPACAIEIDTFVFSANVTNSGADTIMDMTYKVSIYNNDTDELIHTDSLVVAEWAPSYVDSSLTIADTWAPEGLETGLYRIEHTVFNPADMDDFNPADNTVNQFFQVSETVFSKELSGNGRFGTWENGEFYAVGAFYQFGPNCLENYTIASVDYAVGRVGGDNDPLEGRPVEFWLWKLTTTLDSFDATTNYEEDILSISHPSMEFVAFSPDVLDAVDVASNIKVSDEPFLNSDGDEITPIFEAGATYGLFAHWGTQGSFAPLHLYVDDANTGTDLFYSGGWFGGFSGSKSAPILRLRLQMFSSVDDQPLADEALKVYPNPTSDLLNIELNLESTMNATVTIADITGKVISYQNMENVQNDVLTINVSNYTAGTYLARVATEVGTKTVKFVVN